MRKVTRSSKAFMSSYDAELVEAILRRQAQEGALRVLEWGAGISTTGFFRSLSDSAIAVDWTSVESSVCFFREQYPPRGAEVSELYNVRARAPRPHFIREAQPCGQQIYPSSLCLRLGAPQSHRIQLARSKGGSGLLP